MTPDPMDIRSRAEAQFNSRQTPDNEARRLANADLQATRKKTARLKAQRLAKEAREGVAELEQKKPRQGKR